MKKVFIIFAAAIMLAACANNADSAYVKELRSRGADEAEINELIEYEKNNKILPEGGYVDVTERTVAEVAEERGLTLAEYLNEYDLPSDMPALVSETEANYTIPAYRMAQMYDMSFETLKQTFELPDSVDEDTPWGEAIGEATLGAYAGEDNVESFKQMYGLDNSVKADTKYKEVREQVDAAKKRQREDKVNNGNDGGYEDE